MRIFERYEYSNEYYNIRIHFDLNLKLLIFSSIRGEQMSKLRLSTIRSFGFVRQAAVPLKSGLHLDYMWSEDKRSHIQSTVVAILRTHVRQGVVPRIDWHYSHGSHACAVLIALCAWTASVGLHQSSDMANVSTGANAIRNFFPQGPTRPGSSVYQMPCHYEERLHVIKRFSDIFYFLCVMWPCNWSKGVPSALHVQLLVIMPLFCYLKYVTKWLS